MTQEPAQAVSGTRRGATVLVVQPDAADGPGRFATWFADEGLTLRIVRPYDGEPLPTTLDEDALVVLGGDMSANDDADHAWLEGIRALFRQAVRTGRPALGVCLGGQLMAQAFGGSVCVGDRGTESGVIAVSPRPEADDDVVFRGLPAPLPTCSCHRDMIQTLPADAVWLGSSAQYPHQAFRVGDSAWGVQFHPEASPLVFESWLWHEHARDGVLGEPWRRQIDQFRERDHEVISGNEAFARAFAAVVADASGQQREPSTSGTRA